MPLSPRLLAALAAVALSLAGLGSAAIPVPRFTHPGAGQTFYFVLTDRFANGDPSNDRGGLPGGPDDHGFDPTRISHYHGGDFAGLTARLDYLRDLGVTAVWVTPPFRNKPVQQGTAGYHGYWITDFLAIDPHLGTNAEYRTFVREAHARGLRVYMDIIVNHTADVIQLQDDFRYRPIAEAPYRDAAGKAFDARAVAWNGLNDPAAFPALAADTSFPYRPWVPAGEETVKHPAWLNDVTLYHNRGNTTFTGENSVHGDFVGLDDVFTEDPRAVRGFIEIFQHWMEEYGVDGYRIDTVRHVNTAFWQAFGPAIRAHALALGRPDFVQFGEVYNDADGARVLSEFSTNTIPIDTTLDFGFFVAARQWVSQGAPSAAMADFFARDDYYIDHDSNVHTTTTFLGNHDAGRFPYFLRQDNPGASPERLLQLTALGHGLLFLARGQPVIYYGDEQGMIGRGGHDMQARESMFAAQAPAFRDAVLLGTERTGAEDKYDVEHPLYRLLARLGELRTRHAALRTGALLTRATATPELLAFSRIDRGERVEYLAAFNSSREAVRVSRVSTSQPAGARLEGLFHSGAGAGAALTVAADGSVDVRLEPLQFALWRAEEPLPAAEPDAEPLRVALVNPADDARLSFGEREVDGLKFPSRPEIRAEVSGGDGLAEVTFLMERASRPGQYEWIGTDDTAPYRVYWSRPADLSAQETVTFIAAATDLRGREVTDRVAGVTLAGQGVSFGIPGSEVPRLTAMPPVEARWVPGEPLVLDVEAQGTGPLEYQWLRDGERLAGATEPRLVVTAPGRYAVLVRNLAGTTMSHPTKVTAAGEP